MQKYNKLVRDNIPDIIRANGEVPITRHLRTSEYKKELLKKLVEEAQEVASAKGKESLVKELADVQEVLTSLYAVFGIARSDVTSIAKKRRKERGRFAKKIFLKEVK